jgi:hypothetical protein
LTINEDKAWKAKKISRRYRRIFRITERYIVAAGFYVVRIISDFAAITDYFIKK